MKNYHNLRSKNGRFIPLEQVKPNIVPGRLYDFYGTVVRAGAKMFNGLRKISFHKKLTGEVKDSDLKLISRISVNKYLEKK